VSPAQLLKACDGVGAFLTNYFRQEVSVYIPDHDDVCEATAEWGGSTFQWTKKYAPLVRRNQSYILGLSTGGKTYALAKSYIEDNGTGNPDIILELIEREQDDLHPLKGFVIAAFLEVNLELAHKINAARLTIENPDPATLEIYSRLGFDVEWIDEAEVATAELDITPYTEFHWPTCRR
jgi:hypothetical protein